MSPHSARNRDLMLQLALLATLIWSPSAIAASAMDPPAEPPLRTIDNYWRRWQQSTTEVMAGRHASPIYRAPAAAMDAYWRIAAFDRERPWISDADAKNVRDLAQVGALMGLERMIRETFSQSEALRILYRIGSTAGGANIDIRARHNGKPHLAYNDRAAELRADQGTIDDDTRPPRSTTTMRLRTGVAFQVIDQDPAQDVIAPGLAATAYVDARHLGIDALRIQVSNPLPTRGSSTGKRRATTTSGGSWSGTLREGLAPAVDIFA
ncbi:MAG: hypothetical protein GXP62_02370, partial [Oligoflexia bacterium]|nr:hypothetical protein [Oligoflexia bacterium]